MAKPSCLRLFWHFMREAASRTFWTAGRRRPMRMAMMAITTSNSMRVKARRNRRTEATIRCLIKHNIGDGRMVMEGVGGPRAADSAQPRSFGKLGDREFRNRCENEVLTIYVANNTVVNKITQESGTKSHARQ